MHALACTQSLPHPFLVQVLVDLDLHSRRATSSRRPHKGDAAFVDAHLVGAFEPRETRSRGIVLGTVRVECLSEKATYYHVLYVLGKNCCNDYLIQ